MRRTGLYVHVPFCGSLCPYCAFASQSGRDDLHARYAAAVVREIERAAASGARGPLHTVFFGGGTPSRLSPEHVASVLGAAVMTFGLESDAEVTLEANPDTADVARFQAFRQAGCNRISLGIQSFADQALRCLGRPHSAAQALEACRVARQAGFHNLGLDLIFAVPGVPEELWQHSVEQAVALRPEHLSAYALTLEEGTPLARRAARGRLQGLDEEQQAAQFEWTAARLSAAGYEHYEVSNYARPGCRSRHNWGYWSGAEYLGVGPSAHSFLAGRRSWNVEDLDDYLARVEAGVSPCVGGEEIDALTGRRERLWMGLRTMDGVQLTPAERSCLAARPRFAHLRDAGYVHWAGERLCLTPRGFLLADALAVEVTDLLESRAPALACGAGG